MFAFELWVSDSVMIQVRYPTRFMCETVRGRLAREVGPRRIGRRCYDARLSLPKEAVVGEETVEGRGNPAPERKRP